MMIYYVALGISILAGIAGQMLLKAGADAPTLMEADHAALDPVRPGFLRLGGVLLHLCAAQDPLSVAFPSVSLSYALVVGAAYLFRDEPLGWMNIAGVVLISAGVLLVASQK